MCGIAGLVSPMPVAGDTLVGSMRDTMSHRGPDDAGLWATPDRRVWLAHRRLAILDLSPGGHQPMVAQAGQLALTFNGEIYNHGELRRRLQGLGHRFDTTSDTEVLLAAYRQWGRDCVDHLVGMFAFAIFDGTLGQVFLARDRAGEKPLYYRESNGSLWFASELKALLADPSLSRELDLRALNFYLAYGYVPGDMCMIRGVQKLLPGHGLTFGPSGQGVRTWRYWDLPSPDSGGLPSTTEDLVDELESLLENSVRDQLVADVPVGILLSGGIDSSVVTALAARVSTRPVKTFTVSFPGHGDYDEAPYARLVADHAGTEHTQLVAADATVDLLPELARQYDEPVADTSIIPTYLVAQLIRQHAKVALGGDGGDELFGGYLHHSSIQREERYRRLVPAGLRGGVSRLAGERLPVGLKGRMDLVRLGGDTRDAIANHSVVFDAASRMRLLAPVEAAIGPAGREPEAYKRERCGDGTPLRQARVADFRTYMVDDVLTKVDRASMLASLEVRAPWLDHRIIEFAFSRVPEKLLATTEQRKILPRRLAGRLLPPELDLIRKRGFSPPVGAWFRGPWAPSLKSVLLGADPALFDPGTVRRLLGAQGRGYWNVQRLFTLLMFELWRKEYAVDLGGVYRTDDPSPASAVGS